MGPERRAGMAGPSRRNEEALHALAPPTRTRALPRRKSFPRKLLRPTPAQALTAGGRSARTAEAGQRGHSWSFPFVNCMGRISTNRPHSHLHRTLVPHRAMSLSMHPKLRATKTGGNGGCRQTPGNSALGASGNSPQTRRPAPTSSRRGRRELPADLQTHNLKVGGSNPPVMSSWT